MVQNTKKLGELLVQENLIDMKQLQIAKAAQKKEGGRLIEHLSSHGFISEQKLAEFFEKQFETSMIQLENFEIDPEVTKLVSKEICLKHRIIPVSKVGNTVVFATSDPSNQRMVIDDLRYITHSKIEIVVATDSAIKEAIRRAYGKTDLDDMSDLVDSMVVSDDIVEIKGGEEEIDVADVESASQDPIIRFVNTMLIRAIREGASDIHVEPYEKRFRVRYRIDGNLYDRISPPQGAASSIVSRIKILSRLDIAERRLPQDGRLVVKLSGGRSVDFRVSILPTIFGEKVVLRILDKENLQLDLTKLGFESETLNMFRKIIHLPQGMVLLTGPTGSGKTTTIYSALAELNKPDINICTAEDPIEFNLDGINQVQIRADIDLTFAAALRSFLRQDPDVILVGEIRDLETAEIAFKAASTGHMVVSTLHTNDAPSTIIRLMDIGIQPFMVAATVNLVVAQRLIAMLCLHCRESLTIEPSILMDLGVSSSDVSSYEVYGPKGCSHCNQLGYKGRIAVYEAMGITEKVRDAIITGKNEKIIRDAAIQQGMKTLRMSALEKLKNGLTSIEEVVKVTMKG